MQRNIIKFSVGRGGALSASHLLRNDTQQVRAADAAQRHEVEEQAKSFQMNPMADHPRSSFAYKGSTKGAEVGARNEAAFIDYEPFKPRTLTGRLVMPGNINLLTVSPLYCALLCVAAATWGIFYWDLYCRKNYETVLIARPKTLQ
ncbi:hypothetical protein ABL78_6380 [Leptomonas seymouri]|uniref:Transmembrane protein n=1 Tax=Leptomonas seymouri TaxID=5684 RepID=A0A0N1PCY8_LEPSE|nr:hypothetical protein ABL78_6380 [Leptomonas seymouri]|eukprot:KPI84564.1 hypothetical protein ABL78_6380 [Leptomonas seymouri]